MHGKHVLITGPTAGIGFQIAVELCTLGARLTLGCRDVERGASAAEKIRRAAGAPSAIDALPIAAPSSNALPIDVMQVDTSSQTSIREFALGFRNTHPRLDVLVNNAGISQGERNLSVDGIELTFATNVLGYFALTNELLGTLARSAPARIVNVASQFAGNLDLDDLQFARRPFDGLQAYAQSKTCNRLLTWALARRVAGTGVTANAYAPGFVPGTELTRDMPPAVRGRIASARAARRSKARTRRCGSQQSRAGRRQRPILHGSPRAAVRVSQRSGRGTALGRMRATRRGKKKALTINRSSTL